VADSYPEEMKTPNFHHAIIRSWWEYVSGYKVRFCLSNFY